MVLFFWAQDYRPLYRALPAPRLCPDAYKSGTSCAGWSSGPEKHQIRHALGSCKPGNVQHRKISESGQGRVAKVLWTQGAKVSQESFAPPKPSFPPVQPHFRTSARGFCWLEPKDLLHHLLNHFRNCPLFGQFPRSAASQVTPRSATLPEMSGDPASTHRHMKCGKLWQRQTRNTRFTGTSLTFIRLPVKERAANPQSPQWPPGWSDPKYNMWKIRPTGLV